MQWSNYFTIKDYDNLANEQPAIANTIRSSEELARVNNISNNYPWMQPQTISTLAKYNASPDVVRAAGDAAAMRNLGQYESKKNAQGELIAPVRFAFDTAGWIAKTAKAAFDLVVPGTASFVVDNVYDPILSGGVESTTQYFLKPTVRWSTAIFDLVPETAQNVASIAAGSGNYDLFGLWESTSLATMLDDYDNTGDGYFMSQVMREEQAKRARAFRGTIYGSAFTIGRSITQWAGEDSLIYKYGSGVIDAAVMIALPDPSLHVAKALTRGAGVTSNVLAALQSGADINVALKAGKSLVPQPTKADSMIIRKMLSEESGPLRAEAGLTSGMDGERVDAMKFINFMKTNPLAIRLVDTLVGKTNRQEILEDIFKFEISTDTVDELAFASTRDEVIAALTAPFTLAEGTLDPRIGRYRVRKGVSMLTKTRFFTQMPKNSIIFSGDSIDNLESMRNMTLSARTAGVSEDVIKKWGDEAIVSFSNRGTAPAKFDSFRAYEDMIAHQLRANGIEDPTISNIFQRHRGSLDKVRAYLVDRMGIDTDNGHLRMMADILRDDIPNPVYAEFLQRTLPILDDASFAGPAKLVHMIDRTRTLPDARELRRLTRNPLLQKVFSGAGIDMKKLAIAGKRRSILVTRVTDEVEVKKLREDIAELKRGEQDDFTQGEITRLEDQISSMTYTENVRALTGEARLAVDIIDFAQNRIWKPLNLATVGYIVRNGIDAQIRMAFGGVRSLANGGVLHPLEFIHIAIGLPGKGVKYGKSITGVDMTNLGVASRKAISGEPTLITGAGTRDFVYVGDQRFPSTGKGLVEAEKYSKRTGKPMFSGDSEAGMMDNVTAATTVQRQLAENLGAVSSRVGFTPADQVWDSVRTGSFPSVARGADGSPETFQHTKGVVEILQQTTKNESTRIVARGVAQGKSDQTIAEEVADSLLADKGGPAYRDIAALHKQGRMYKSDKHPGGDYNAPVNFAELIRNGQESVVRNILINDALAIDIASHRQLTGKIPELEFLAAYDGVGDFTRTQSVNLSSLTRIGPGTGGIKVGGRVQFGEESGIVTKIEQASPDADVIATFVPLIESGSLSGHAFGRSGVASQRLIQRTPISPDGIAPGLPVRVPSEQISRSKKDLGELEKAGELVEIATGWLFNVLNDTAVRKLERSVTFRQFYYQEVGKHIERLSALEGQRYYDDVLSKAQAEGKTIREYLGESVRQKGAIYKKIEKLNGRTSATGTLDVRDLDDYARFVGLSKTKELLYDATDRNNIVDALRLVMPFAGAWKDVIGTYMVLGAQHNIHMVRQFSRVFKGAQQADPDGDGRGFLFKDPQTNEVQFQFPLTGSLSKLLTGIDAPLSAPLSRLSQGISIYPALGPYGQIAVSKLLPDAPQYDDIKELLLPYGELDLKGLAASVFPGVIRKAFEATVADTENRANTYGNTYIEVLRALSVNPRYDLSTEIGQNELMSDAKSRARILTMMRMASQFLGPAAGTQEWKVPTSLGDQYVGVLIEELRRFQLDDYDSAIDRFLTLYGEEMVLYVGSKSRAIKDGLEATEEFGKWERSNRGVLAAYERTGGYFAPMGADYSYTVWLRQLEEGSRERLSDRELIEQAQKRVGSTKYRAMRLAFPANPNEKQRGVLAAYRAQLNEDYPGFPLRSEFVVGKFPNSITELEKAVEDSRLADNPITPVLKEYLDQRRLFILMGNGESLASQKKLKQRAALFLLGETLSEQNPEFDRMWSRLLSQEVE